MNVESVIHWIAYHSKTGVEQQQSATFEQRVRSREGVLSTRSSTFTAARDNQPIESWACSELEHKLRHGEASAQGRRLHSANYELVPRQYWLTAEIELSVALGGKLGVSPPPPLTVPRYADEPGAEALMDFRGYVALDFDSASIRNLWPSAAVTEAVRTGPSQLTRADRQKGGGKPRYNAALQQAIDRIRNDLEQRDPAPRRGRFAMLRQWFEDRDACLKRGQPSDELRQVEFEPMILDCDDLYMDERGSLVWKDSHGREQSIKPRSLDPYLRRAFDAAS